jgi:DNA-binding LacI/PurR family transcriptional regulator
MMEAQRTRVHPMFPALRTKPVSIKDIARMAGVSHSTVSRALRDSPLISPGTTRKIQQLARESGYRASAVARGLVARKTMTIGVVVTTIADPFVGEVVGGIEESANEQGYSVFLADSNADPEREKKVVQSFAERRVDGILVTSSRVGALYVPLLSEMNVPIVLINNQHSGEWVHSVMIENVKASLDATEHLIALGHRRIAYLGDRFGHQSDIERCQGYREALRREGIAFLPELAVLGDGKPPGGMAAMESLLQLNSPPTAVFCYNDMSALGAMRCIRNRGLRVPEDVSLVGFDDLYISAYTNPALTTVRQPRWIMGRLAMESLLNLISGRGSADTIHVPAELIVRESTAPPRKESK